MLPKLYAEVTLIMDMVAISACILDPFRKLQLFRKWDMTIINNPEYKTSYTAHNQEAFLKYVENEYCAKDRHLPMIKPESLPSNNLFPSAMASRSDWASSEAYEFSSDDERYIPHENVANTMPRHSDQIAF